MFGKRATPSEPTRRAPPAAPVQADEDTRAPAPPPFQAAAAPPPPPKPAAPAKTVRVSDARSDDYYRIKTTIFNALIDTIDLAQLAQLDADTAREEIRDIVNEIISIKAVVMSIAEQ